MKVTNLVLSVFCLLAFTACQSGKVSRSNTSIQQLNGGSATIPDSGVIDLGTMSAGADLNVEANPTPIPTATPVQTVTPPLSTGAIDVKPGFWIARALSFFATEAFAQSNSDSYQIYDSNALMAKLQLVVGSELANYQNLYQNYVVSLASNSATPVPVGLQKVVNISFTSVNAQISSIVLPLVSVLSPNATVITYGSHAYYGVGVIPAASASVFAMPLAGLVGAKYVKVGSALKILGGKVGSILNRNIATVTFPNSGSFVISSAPSSISTSASLVNVAFKPVNASVAGAASLSSGYIGQYALIANINSNNKIYGFSLLKFSTGVISSSSASCASVVSFFPGYTCQGAGSGGTPQTQNNGNLSL